MEENKKPVEPSVDLQQLVAEADTGGRKVGGAVGKLILCVAVGWSLFQLWYASPLPFVLGWGILNDTEARSLHLGIALFLGFLCYPAFKSSSRKSVPWYDWILAIAGAFAGAYFLLFYAQLATRPGQPNLQDIVVASAGIVLLLEATRRAVGLPMTVLAILFLVYIMFGKYMPDVLAHKGASLGAHALAPVAHHRGRLRRGARRVLVLHLHLRALRRAARPRGRRQLHDAGVDGAARPPARRPREGGRRVLGPERPHLRARRSPTWSRAASSPSRS